MSAATVSYVGVQEYLQRRPPADEAAQANQMYANIKDEAYMREKFDAIRREYDEVMAGTDDITTPHSLCSVLCGPETH